MPERRRARESSGESERRERSRERRERRHEARLVREAVERRRLDEERRWSRKCLALSVFCDTCSLTLLNGLLRKHSNHFGLLPLLSAGFRPIWWVAPAPVSSCASPRRMIAPTRTWPSSGLVVVWSRADAAFAQNGESSAVVVQQKKAQNGESSAVVVQEKKAQRIFSCVVRRNNQSRSVANMRLSASWRSTTGTAGFPSIHFNRATRSALGQRVADLVWSHAYSDFANLICVDSNAQVSYTLNMEWTGKNAGKLKAENVSFMRHHAAGH